MQVIRNRESSIHRIQCGQDAIWRLSWFTPKGADDLYEPLALLSRVFSQRNAVVFRAHNRTLSQGLLSLNRLPETIMHLPEDFQAPFGTVPGPREVGKKMVETPVSPYPERRRHVMIGLLQCSALRLSHGLSEGRVFCVGVTILLHVYTHGKTWQVKFIFQDLDGVLPVVECGIRMRLILVEFWKDYFQEAEVAKAAVRYRVLQEDGGGVPRVLARRRVLPKDCKAVLVKEHSLCIGAEGLADEKQVRRRLPT